MRVGEDVPEDIDLGMGEANESDCLLREPIVPGHFECLVAEEERTAEGAPVVAEHHQRRNCSTDGERGEGPNPAQPVERIAADRRGDQKNRIVVVHGKTGE